MVREVQLALPAGSTLGMGLQKPSIGQVGVWVNRIAPGGAASRIRPEVRVGDVVVEIDGRAVLGARLVDVSERLKPKGRLVRVAFVHRTELDSAVAAVDPLGSANAGRFAEDDIGRVTGTARGNGNAADEYAPQRDDGVGNGDSRRRSASHSDGATDVGKDDENGSRHLGRNRSSSDGWETQNFDGGWKQRGGRQNHGSGSFSAAFLATDSDGTDGIGVDPSDGVALDASAGGARDTGGARERWEEPVGGGRYDDEDEWRGVGQHMMSPVRAEETSTYESLSFRSGAARARLRDAAKGAAKPPTSPVRDVYEDRDPNRAPREVDRLNPSEDFKLTVKSELKPVAAYVPPLPSSLVFSPTTTATRATQSDTLYTCIIAVIWIPHVTLFSRETNCHERVSVVLSIRTQFERWRRLVDSLHVRVPCTVPHVLMLLPSTGMLSLRGRSQRRMPPIAPCVMLRGLNSRKTL